MSSAQTMDANSNHSKDQNLDCKVIVKRSRWRPYCLRSQFNTYTQIWESQLYYMLLFESCIDKTNYYSSLLFFIPIMLHCFLPLLSLIFFIFHIWALLSLNVQQRFQTLIFIVIIIIIIIIIIIL